MSLARRDSGPRGGISLRGWTTLVLGASAVLATAASPSCAAGTNELSGGGQLATAGATTGTGGAGTGGFMGMTTGGGMGGVGGKGKGGNGGEAGGKGGMGGEGGTGGSAGGAGGNGATTTSNGGMGGGGGAGGEGGAGAGGKGGGGAGGQGGSGGAAATGVALLLAGGGAKVLAGEFHTATGWATSTLSDTTLGGAGLTMTSGTTAVGVIASSMNATALDYTTWTPGTWTAFTGLAAGVTGQSRPALAATGTTADLVFWGGNDEDYFASYAGAWLPTAEPVLPNGGVQSFGPSAPALVTLAGDAVIAYAGNDHNLYDQTRHAGAWQTATGHGVPNTLSITPAIIAPTALADRMIVFNRDADSQLFWTARNNGTWSPPAAIPNALSAAPVALLALANGGALLAYEGTNQVVYWSVYAPAAMTPWSAPASLGFNTSSSPSLSPGIGTAQAEMAFAEPNTTTAYHARFTGGVWNSPAMVGGTGVTWVAIASSP